MTFEELLKACSSGRMPEVETEAGDKGTVVTIKNGDGYHGCAVRFWSFDYNTWFYAKDGSDRRCRYMKELKLVNPL